MCSVCVEEYIDVMCNQFRTRYNSTQKSTNIALNNLNTPSKIKHNPISYLARDWVTAPYASSRWVRSSVISARSVYKVD